MPGTEQWTLVFFLAGAILAFGRWMATRIVKQTDDVVKANSQDIALLRDRVLRLEGVVSAESWGLVSVVGKLNGNVEKLTSAVEHINTVLVMQKEQSSHG